MGLEEHRREVELVDEGIIRLIDKRVQLAGKILEAKNAEGRPIKDPERERQVLARAERLAEELGLDAGAVREIFEVLIRMSLRKQHELLSKKQI